jgi:hypothetical protein
MLDSAESIAEVMDVLTEGLVDAVFLEVQKALKAAYNATNRPTANKYSTSSFNAGEFWKLISVVRAYGDGVVIFAPPEFVGAMGPDVLIPAIAGQAQGIYHPQDLDAIHNTGYINLFRGTPIVQIPQSFVDENNVETWIDPQLAYVLPTGGERVVKVVFEGGTQMWDFVNADQSMEIHTYRKLGTAILAYHNWGIYKNENIPQTYKEMYPNV